MKRTMHVLLTLPVEVLDPTLSKKDVTRMVSAWIEAATAAHDRDMHHSNYPVPLRLRQGPNTCTVYAVKEEKDD